MYVVIDNVIHVVDEDYISFLKRKNIKYTEFESLTEAVNFINKNYGGGDIITRE